MGPATRWLRAAVPDAGHTGGLATDPVGWERRVDAFLTSALAPSS